VKKIRLGKTGLMVSRVGMGGIPIQRPPFDEAVRIIQHAIELGVNFIDTAVGYGDSEERIGKGVAGRRDEVILATKTPGRDKATALEHLETSLKRLNTDYIDLWQLHNLSTFEEYDKVLGLGGAMEAAQEALEVGKICHIGLSSHNIDVALKAVSSGHFETIQFPFNFVLNEAADELVPLAREHDVGFIAMKSFAGGMLNDANLTIKYLLQFDNVVPDPGIEKADEIEEIVGIINGSWELTSQERQEIEDIRARMSTQFCRRCGYCMPCPNGVIILPLTYIPSLWKVWNQERFLYWNFVTDAIESWKNCIQCGECEEKCPYHLPIREMIKENIDFYEKVTQEYAESENRVIMNEKGEIG
jgi:predicted aldo/keto reductase-like oxidoreductase